MENIEKLKDYDFKNFALVQDYGITKELRERFCITIYKNESEWFYRITFNAKDIKFYENVLNKFSLYESDFIQKGFNLTNDLICNDQIYKPDFNDDNSRNIFIGKRFNYWTKHSYNSMPSFAFSHIY